MELPPVKLVAFLHYRQFTGLSWIRRTVKVRVLKGVDRVDPFLPIESHQFSEKSDSTMSVSVISSAVP